MYSFKRFRHPTSPEALAGETTLPTQAAARATRPSTLHTLMVLFKARVVSLLLFAALGGAFVASGGWPGWQPLAVAMFSGWLAASGASALNQYIERKSDGVMTRTRHRPLVDGTIPNPAWVPWVATAMIALAVGWTWTFNRWLSFWLAMGAFIYVVVYTVWLKPRTPLNIVIGGAAGSAAVLSGAAAAGRWDAPAALVLAMLVFLWTPTHFWSLAIVYRHDYARSDTPMLPVMVSPRQAAFWVFLHTAATAFAALALAFDPALGLIYAIPVGLATADLLWRNVRLLRTPTPKLARSLFIASNLYLTVVLVMACVASLITPA
ncbi:MAG: heme o synthase [Caldilineales bacterium]|nr:heme o synthase [Caldilineales bacterium]MDW8317312.1 heme o synthase [Anaerolineae bacterium]